MNAKEFLNNVSKEIKYKPANKPITEELESHIEEAKKDYLCKGYSANEAEEMAVEQMGNGMLYAIWAVPVAVILMILGSVISRRKFIKHQVYS